MTVRALGVFGYPDSPSPGTVAVEGDWSNGAFFLCLGALLKEGVTVKGLDEGSTQADKAVLAVLEEMGAQVERSPEGITVKKGDLKGVTVDASHIPDLVPVLSIVGALAEGKTKEVLQNPEVIKAYIGG